MIIEDDEIDDKRVRLMTMTMILMMMMMTWRTYTSR